MRPVSTFSIVARDAGNADLGVATASRFLAVGAVVPYAVAGVGAVATQSHANVGYGARVVQALRAGVPLALIHGSFAATDPGHATRQYGMVDASGASLSFTGEGCHPWSGGRTGEGYAVQGNLLAGPQVIEALAETFEATMAPLPERLLAALAAADEAGGDARGRQAAALLVVRAGGGYGGGNDRYVDLRIDDDPAPVPRLTDLLEMHRLLFDAPRSEDLLEIDGEVERRLLDLLRVHGLHVGGESGWDDAADAALRGLAGAHNLEERLVPGRRVDRLLLEHLESAEALAGDGEAGS